MKRERKEVMKVILLEIKLSFPFQLQKMAYKVVSIALDLTGRRLTDEICHVAAFCHPDKTFSQYVMPFNDVSLVGVKAHGVRVFTTTFG